MLEEQAKLASECLVTVSQDKMEAYVTLEKGSCKTKNEIMRLLAKENIVFGIKQDNIEKYLKESDHATNRFLAAEGVRPERGRDGYYEFFFRTGIPQIPAIREDGSIDYKNTVYFEFPLTQMLPLKRKLPVEMVTSSTTRSGCMVISLFLSSIFPDSLAM